MFTLRESGRRKIGGPYPTLRDAECDAIRRYFNTATTVYVYTGKLWVSKLEFGKPRRGRQKNRHNLVLRGSRESK